jgi:xanthine/uracil permease
MSKQHDNVGILGERGGVATRIVMVMLAALLLVSSLIPSLAAPAKAQTQEPPPD